MSGTEQLIESLKMLRDYTGMGAVECRRALERCEGDALMAVGYLKYNGSLINLKGGSQESWLLGQARSYAKLLCIKDGKIGYQP